MPSSSPLSRLVPQGEYALSAEPGVELRAVLGSCVAICLHDPTTGIGGMTHSVFAERHRLGAAIPLNEYERLFNAMTRRGARRAGMRAWVVGGAHLLSSRKRPGATLAELTLTVLRREGLTLEEVALGGCRARLVRFAPASGALRIEVLADPAEPGRDGVAGSGGVELF